MKTRACCLALALLPPSLLFGQPVSWDGGGDGVSWHDPLNWSGDAVPGTNNDVLIAPAAATTVHYQGAPTPVRSLINHATLWVRGGASGHAVLSVNGDFTNHGTLRLQTISGGWESSAVVGGTLVNETDGVIEVNPGTGGSRYLTASVVNRGVLNITGGASLYANGDGKVFRQETGSIIVTNLFTWAGGRFDFVGGSLAGAVAVRSGSLEVAASAGASTIVCAENSTLLANRATNVTVWVQGGLYGHAALTTAEGAVNAGIIRLETSSSSWQSILNVGGSNLVNTASGIIASRPGTGGDRSINGYLVNHGLVDATGHYVNLTGTYEAAGGRILGGGRLVNGQLKVTASPATPTLIDLWATTTLLSDVLPNTELWVHGGGSGHATLTSAGNVTNYGTIRLETQGGGWDDTLNVGGVLVNAPGGVLQVNPGTGGARMLTANLVNQGTINVAPGTGLYANGAGREFRQEGLLNAEGYWTWAQGLFDFAAGSLQGTVWVLNGTLRVRDTVISDSTVFVSGTTTLLANDSPAAGIWVRGGGQYGHATLAAATNAVNTGRLLLQTTDGGWNSVLTTTAHGFVNKPTGIIEAQPGSGGDRSCSGLLVNQGAVLATNGGFFNFYGTYQADGGTMEGSAALINGEVRVTRSSSSPTTIPLRGAVTLTTDNLTNTLLWVQGGGHGYHGSLTSPGGFANGGTIRLQTISGGYASDLIVITGALRNASSGVLEVNTGTGGPRNLTATLDNEGLLAIEPGITLYCHGTNRIWNQLGGAVTAAGVCTWADGPFNLLGGDIAGTLYLRNATVDVAATATHSNTVIATASSTLRNNLSPQTTIWVCGGPYDHATLSAHTNGSVNLGTIRLESRNGGYTSALSAPGAGLTNGPTGVIASGNGSGGPRWLSGTLVNQGLVDATGNYLDLSGFMEEAGGRFEGPARIRNSVIRVTAGPATPTTMLLWSVNTLASDNLPNVTLLVQGGGDGHATLNWTNGWNNFGTIALDSINGGYGAALNVNGGALNNRAGGLMEFRPGTGGGRPVNAELVNNGDVRANASASFSGMGANHSSGGSIQLANATLTFSGATFTNLPGALLAGSGTFDVSGVTFHNAGRLSPGSSPGRLTFNGSMSESDTAQLDVEIGGPTVATEFDQVVVTGAARVAGEVNITMSNGYVPFATNVFPVMTVGSMAGGFSTFNGLAIDADHVFEPFYKTTQFELRLLVNTNLPTILVQPASQSVAQGNPVQFQVTANGTPPLSYQWRFKGSDLPGETRNTLAFASAATNLTGGYNVVVSNSAGAVTSAVATLIVTVPSQVVYWDGGGDGTNWSDPLNWSGDFVPGVTNNVIADVASDVTITVTNTTSVRSLQSEEGLLVAGGAFTVTDGASWVHGRLTVNANRGFTARGSNVTFTATGPTVVDGALLTALDGASLSLPNAGLFTGGLLTLSNNATASLAALTNVNLTRFFLYAGSTFALPASVTNYSSSGGMGINEQRTVMSVSGADSRLDLSALKSFDATFSGLGGLRQLFVATAGGELDLSGTTRIQGGGSGVNGGGPLEFRTDATGRIRLDALSQLTGTGAGILVNLAQAYTEFPQLAGATVTQFQLPAGAECAAPALASLQSCRLTIPNAARFVAPSLSVFGNCTLDLSGSGLFQHGALATVDLSRFYLSAGATYTLPPQIGSFSSSGSFGVNEQRTLLSATGTGTRLDFSSLTNMEGVFSGLGGLRLLVVANSGAVIDLSGLRTLTGGGSGVNGGGPFEFRSDDTGKVRLTALERVSGSGAGVLINLAGTNTLGASQLMLTNAELTLPTNSLVSVGTLQLGPDGDLSGAGFLQGDVLNGGYVRAGSSAGRLTILGNYTQAVTGTFIAEVGGANAGTQYDQLVVSSNAVLGGTLDLRLIANYAPDLTNRFQILAGGSRLGQFANLIGADAGQSVEFIPAYETNAVWLGLAFATGPSVVACSPAGIIGDTFDRFVLTFSETLASSSFTTADISLTGPAGALTVNAPQLLSNTTWQITFAAQSQPGDYTLTLGPAVTDLVGNAMNQNGDMINGQAIEDRFIRTVTIPPPVDFVPTEVAAPAGAVVGTPVPLSWVVLNQSTNPAAGPRTDAVYLSTDNKVGGDVLLGQFTTLEGLAGGEARAVTNSVLIPIGTSGPLYFIVVADSPREWFETSETNNTFVSTNATIVSAADLAVTSVSASKTAAQFGESLTVTWVVRNNGSAAAGAAWRDRVYLSPTASVTAQSIVMPPDVNGGPLGAGASYTNSTTVTLPLDAGWAAGTFFLVVRADANNSQAEASEANNTASLAISLTFPPLPDLVPSGVAANVSSRPYFLPRETVELTWTVTNSGVAVALGGWTEAIYAAEKVTNSPSVLLARFHFTNDLASGSGVIRTQTVTLPVAGLAGDVRFAVVVDSDAQIVESAETNNTAWAMDTVLVPPAFTLTLPGGRVAENTANPNLTALLQRNGSLSNAVVVALASSDTNELTVPATVTIPAGQASATFPATVQWDRAPDADAIVTITASAAGFTNGTATLTVLNVDAPQLVLAPASGALTEGDTLAVTVSRSPATDQPLVVSLASQSPTVLITPVSVTIPPYSNSASFKLAAPQDTLIESPVAVSFTASAAGHLSGASAVTVLDDDIPIVLLALNPASVAENAGGGAVVGTVFRVAATSRELTLQLEASDSNAVALPYLVTIPANESSATFALGVVNDALINGTRQVGIAAYVTESLTGARFGEPATNQLTILDDDGPALSLTLARTLLPEGSNTFATVTRNTPTTNDLVVTLTSSDPTEAAVPASVTI
ncbi:MAG TPA: CARDB domain-containing protein, partial [Verrucomicrobiae bacterium]